MFCLYCGTENSAQSKFCKLCGKELIPQQELQGEPTVCVSPQQPYTQPSYGQDPYTPYGQAPYQQTPDTPPQSSLSNQGSYGAAAPMTWQPEMPSTQQPSKKKKWPTVLLISLVLLLLAAIVAVIILMMGGSDEEEHTPTTESTSASTMEDTQPEEPTEEQPTEEEPQTQESVTAATETAEPEPSEETEPATTETGAPTTQSEPATQGTPVNLTPDLQYSVNIFLSNFSEQGFVSEYVWDQASQTYIVPNSYFESESSEPMPMIKMAWLNAKINGYEYEYIHHNNTSYYGVSLDTINYLTEWFFGRSISAQDVVPEDWYGYQNWIVLDNMVCQLAADGETYNDMSVANEMTDLGNGLYRVSFTVYAAEIGSPLANAGGPIQDKSVYYFSTAEAAAHQYLDAWREGCAIVKPYVTPNGTSTYTLVSYELFAD